jgi:hypothetical protein
MDTSTINILIGSSIAIVSSLITVIVTSTLQNRRDDKKYRIDLWNKLIDDNLAKIKEFESEIHENFEQFIDTTQQIYLYRMTDPVDTVPGKKISKNLFEIIKSLEVSQSLIDSKPIDENIDNISNLLYTLHSALDDFSRIPIPEITDAVRDEEREKRFKLIGEIKLLFNDLFYMITLAKEDVIKREN